MKNHLFPHDNGSTPTATVAVASTDQPIFKTYNATVQWKHLKIYETEIQIRAADDYEALTLAEDYAMNVDEADVDRYCEIDHDILWDVAAIQQATSQMA